MAMNSNGPLNKMGSTLKKDWGSFRRSYQDFKKTGGVFDGLTKGGDKLLRRLGRGNYGKGGAKLGGYMLGGAMLFDFLNPFSD